MTSMHDINYQCSSNYKQKILLYIHLGSFLFSYQTYGLDNYQD